MPELSVKNEEPVHGVTAIQRQEAAEEFQRMDENLGFSSIRPKESRAGCPSFP
jgi:hypothetical protein